MRIVLLPLFLLLLLSLAFPVLQSRALEPTHKPSFTVLQAPAGPTLAPAPSATIPDLSDEDDLMSNPMAAQVEQLEKFLQHPVVRRLYRLANSPSFQDAATKLATHPERKTLWISEAAWGVFMLVFRAWRYSKARSW